MRDALEAVGVEGAPPPPTLDLKRFPSVKRDYEVQFRGDLYITNDDDRKIRTIKEISFICIN